MCAEVQCVGLESGQSACSHDLGLLLSAWGPGLRSGMCWVDLSQGEPLQEQVGTWLGRGWLPWQLHHHHQGGRCQQFMPRRAAWHRASA